MSPVLRQAPAHRLRAALVVLNDRETSGRLSAKQRAVRRLVVREIDRRESQNAQGRE